MIPEKPSSLIANCLFIEPTCLLYFLFPTAIKGLPQYLWQADMSSGLLESIKMKYELCFIEAIETSLLISCTRNALLHFYLGQTVEYLCQSQLCEQIASQTGCSVRHPCPAVPHSSTEKTSVPHKPLRLRPRPASAVMDLWRTNPERDFYSHYSEVGSLCRRRRRPAPALQHSPGQRRTAARSRPCSVIETSVTRETQSMEPHHRVRCQMANIGMCA